MATSETVYKNQKLIVLESELKNYNKYPFQFGVKKALLILDNLEGIRRFVEESMDERFSVEEDKARSRNAVTKKLSRDS